jgi:hypothetical protein
LHLLDPVCFAPAQHVTKLMDLIGIVKIDSVLGFRVSAKSKLYFFLVRSSHVKPKKCLARHLFMPNSRLFGLKEAMGESLAISVGVREGDYPREEVLQGFVGMARCLYPKEGKYPPIGMVKVDCKVVKTGGKRHELRALVTPMGPEVKR